MHFLIDNNLPKALTAALIKAGHEADHVHDLGWHREPDTVLTLLAGRDGQVIITADTDFGEIMARNKATKPSIILIRGELERHREQLIARVLAEIASYADLLAEGVMLVISPGRVRYRPLPIPASIPFPLLSEAPPSPSEDHPHV